MLSSADALDIPAELLLWLVPDWARPETAVARTAANLASDVLGTDAAWYLDVEPVAAEVRT